MDDPDEDTRWAYGTGFTDPFDGLDTTVPPGTDRADLAAYCLMLGDDALILSHRLQQWVTRAPEIEDELAIANIALDLLGQARLLLTRAAAVEDAGRDEDQLAYLRDEGDFRNVRLVERADPDFAHLVARLLALSSWRLAVLERLTRCGDPVLAAIAAKGVKEVTYHREYAAQWVVRLGDGTDLSGARMQDAVEAIAAGDLFTPHEIELRLAATGHGVDPATVRPEVESVWARVLDAAGLKATAWGPGEPRGRHTPAMREILTELQGVARDTPGGTW
ncbi:1,2-phenylacetyl-CoA epoxidase subunit PaaC [Actinoplanes sp. NPDC051494]|uniref:1,2-phenylacetyl-CoA epoxidase subunit PaaC n=1 Tax=Actinoplanes sp. NPDC051494 TaxID=3363907 RepID=UPI0037A71DC0